jgi:tRNA(fMet)-specific endonuclease VapC
MPLYLLDTNAVSDLVKGHPKVVARMQACPDQPVINAIVRGEVIHGLARMPPGKRRNAIVAQTGLVLAKLPVEAITATIADRYGQLRADLEAVGLPLDDNDLWIAAAVLTLGAILVTRDTDFQRVPGLLVEDWTQ